MASTIGIKIANGEFYSIIEENSSVKKRLILTTVHDRQHSVQIDLYRSVTRTMDDAQYIGSLVVESIKPKPKGEPSIELVISSNKTGEIAADAIDLDIGANGEHHILNVSLRSLDEDGREYEIPDFELEHSETPPSGLYQQAEVIHEEKKKFPWTLVILIGVALILVIAALWLFFLGGKEMILFTKNRPAVEQPVQATPPVAPAAQPPAPQPTSQPPASVAQPASPPPASQPAQPSAPPPEAPPPKPAVPPPVIQAPASAPPARPQTADRKRPSPPVASYKVPATIPRGGVPYKIRWGDTLWDISEAFYRNPWLYPRIARFNKIRNPDLIISGTTIRIPPKN